MAREPIIERLAKLDTCAVSDGMDRLGLKGATFGVRPMWPCPKVAGRAVTMKIKPVGLEKPKQHLGTAAIVAANPGDIIVIDNGGRPDTSCWGGLLSLASKAKGISGVVIDGACRDIDESREVAFPVYARGVVPMTARGRVMQESFNQEIEFAGVQVHPGDEYAARHDHSLGKTECWYVMDTEPGARLAVGLRQPLSTAELRAAVNDGSIEKELNWIEVRPGDFVFVPWGTVHAIGAGLTFSAATNTCAMGQAISAMPWNKAAQEPTRESAILQFPVSESLNPEAKAS